MPTFRITFNDDYDENDIYEMFGYQSTVSQLDIDEYLLNIDDEQFPTITKQDVMSMTTAIASIDDMSTSDSDYSDDDTEEEEHDEELVEEEDVDLSDFSIGNDATTIFPTTAEEFDGGTEYVDSSMVMLPSDMMYIRIACDVEYTTNIPIQNSNPTRHIYAHADVQLYLHPDDIHQADQHGRVYDHRGYLLGKIPMQNVIYPVDMHLSNNNNMHTHTNYINSSDVIPVYPNPYTTTICRKIVPGTPVIYSDLYGGHRRMVYIQHMEKDWVCIGWVGKDVRFKSRITRNGFTLSKTTTIDDYFHTVHLEANRGIHKQFDLVQLFELIYKNSILPSPFNRLRFVKCDGQPQYQLTSVQKEFQPISVRVSVPNQTIEDILGKYMRTVVQKFVYQPDKPYKEQNLLRSCMVDGKDGPGTVRLVLQERQSTSPDAFVLSCTRTNMVTSYAAPRDGAIIEDMPIRPSEYITLYGNRYQLVSFAAKSGSHDGGHWTSIVKTKNNQWYQWSDEVCTSVKNIETMRNGVVFLYQKVHYPLFDINMSEGLNNPRFKCWANAFSQTLRYSSYIAESIGVTHGRCASFAELLALVDPTKQLMIF